MQFARDPTGDFGLNRRQIFGPELMTTCPQVLAASRLADPHIDPQLPRIAPLRTAGDKVKVFSCCLQRLGKSSWCAVLLCQGFEVETAAMAQEVRD